MQDLDEIGVSDNKDFSGDYELIKVTKAITYKKWPRQEPLKQDPDTTAHVEGTVHAW